MADEFTIDANAFMAQALADVPMKPAARPESENTAIQKLIDLFTKYMDNFDTKMDEASSYAQEQIDAWKEYTTRRDTRRDSPGPMARPEEGTTSSFSDKVAKMFSPLGGMAKQFKQSLGYDRESAGLDEKSFKLDQGILGITRATEKLQTKHFGRFKFGSPQIIQIDPNSINELAGKVAEATGYYMYRSSRAGAGGGVPMDRAPMFGGFKHRFSGVEGGFGFGAGGPKARVMEGVNELFAGIALFKLFQGAIVEEYKFMQGMREIAYQTESVTSASNSLQRTWERIGKTVKYTGVSRGKFQKAYLENLKHGYKSLKQTHRITEIGLFTSKQIGDESGRLAGTFMKWGRELQVSTGELSSIAASTRQVAKETGITGENLAEVVERSGEFMKIMRNTGNLSASVSENIIGMTAAFEKYGVQEFGGQITKALAGGTQLLLEANSQMRTFLFSAAQLSGDPGMIQKVFTGEVMASRRSMRDFTAGMDKRMQAFVGISESFADFDLGELSDNRRMQLNIVAKQVFGAELGELQRTIQGLKETTMTFGEKRDKITKQIREESLTTQEMANLRQKERDLVVATSQKILGTFDGALKRSKDIESAFNTDAVEEMMRDMNLEGTFKDLFGTADIQGPQEAMARAGELMGKNLQEEARRLNMGLEVDISKLNKQLRSNDPSKVREAIDSLNKENQRLAAEAEASTDPIKGVQFRIAKANDAIRDTSQKILDTLATMLGETGIIIGILGIIAASVAGGTLGKIFSPAFGTITARLSRIGSLFVQGANATRAARIAAGAPAGIRGGLAMVGGGLTRAFPMATRALSGLAGVASKLFWPVTIAAGAMAGLYGAFKSGQHAADMFQTSIEDLTMVQKHSAESAGLLTGILNFLTLGIFSNALGPTGTLTQKLAKFFEAFWPLTYVFQALLFPFKVLFGVLKGLWLFVKNTFIGLWEGIKIAFEPFVELWHVIQGIFEDFSQAFGGFGPKAKDIPSIIDVIANAFGFLGKVLGFVFKAIGLVVNVLLKVFIYPLIAAIKLISKIIKPILATLAPIFSAIMEFIGGIAKTLMGIFTLDGRMILEGIKQAFRGIGNLLWSVITSPFRLIGEAFKAVFIEFPVWLYEKIKEGLAGLADWLASLIPEGVREAGSNVAAGWEGGEAAKKANWGTARGLGTTGRGLKETLLGDELSLRGQTLGRLEGIGNTLWGAGETVVGLGGNLIGRGWLWHKGGMIPGVGEKAIIAEGGEIVVPKDVAAQGIPAIMEWLKNNMDTANIGEALGIPAFAAGTPEVTQTGLATVHAGEAIIPAEALAKYQGTEIKYTGGGGDMQSTAQATMMGLGAYQIPDLGKKVTGAMNAGISKMRDMGGVAGSIFKNADINRVTDTVRIGWSDIYTKTQRWIKSIGDMTKAWWQGPNKWGTLLQEVGKKGKKGIDLIKAGFVSIKTSRLANELKQLGVTIKGSKAFKYASTQFRAASIQAQRLGLRINDAFGGKPAALIKATGRQFKGAVIQAQRLGLRAGRAIRGIDFKKMIDVKGIGKNLGQTYDAFKKMTMFKNLKVDSTAAYLGAPTKRMTMFGKALTWTESKVYKAFGWTDKADEAAATLARFGKTGKGVIETLKGVPVIGKPLGGLASQVSRLGAPLARLGTVIKDGAGTVKTGLTTMFNNPAVKAAGSKFLAVLGPIIGGISGFAEASKEGLGVFKGKGLAGKIEGMIMGAVTGGAGTHSIFGSMGIVEKHSTADEALGVAGAATTAALSFGAIAQTLIPIPGASFAAGAAIGGITGTIVQLFKIFTDGNSKLRAFLESWAPMVGAIIKPIIYFVEAAKEQMQGLWKVVKGIFTLDFKMVGEGLLQVLLAVPKALLKTVGAVIRAIVFQILAIPKHLAIIIFKIPQLLWQAISGIFSSIGGMADEMTGPIGILLRNILLPFKIIGQIASAIATAFGGMFDIVIGIFSFDFERIKKGFMAIFSEVPNILGSIIGTIGKALLDTLVNLPMWLIGALENVFVTLPKMLMEKVTAGLTSLAGGMFGPIFQPILEVWESLKGVLMEVVTPFEDVFNMLRGVFGELKDALLGIFEPFFGPLVSAEAGASSFASTIGGIAKVLGWVIKTAIIPLKIAIQALGYVVKAVMAVLKPILMGIVSVVAGVAKILSGFIYVLTGIFTLDGEKIKKGFKKIWDGLLQIVWGVVKGIGLAIWNLIKNIPGLLWNAIKFIGKMLWQTVKLIGMAIIGIPALIVAGLIKLPELIWKGISSLFSWIGGAADGVKGPFGNLFKMILMPFKIIGRVAQAIGEVFGGLWDIVAGIFTLDFGRIGSGLWAVISAIPKMLWDVFKTLPVLLFKGITAAIKIVLRGIIWLATELPKMLWDGISSLFNWIGGAADGVTGPLGKIFQFILYPFKIIGKIAGAIANTFGGLFDIVKGIFTLDFGLIGQGIWKVISSIPAAIWDVISGIPAMLGNALLGIGELLKAVFWDFPTWLLGIMWDGLVALPGLIMDGLAGLGGLLLDGLKAVLIDFPVWLFNTIVDGLASLGTWLWDHTIGAIIDMIPDWVKNLFGGAAEGFSETSGEQWDTMMEKGPSMGHGVGGMAGGVGDILTGDILGGAGKIAGGAVETVAGAGKAVWDGAKAVVGALNPFNWFEEGAREIKQTGIGMLHEGEAVIPADIVEKMIATGAGPFMGGGFLSGILGGIGDTVTGLASTFVKGAGNTLNTLTGGLAGNVLEGAKSIGSWLFGGKGDKQPLAETGASIGAGFDKVTGPLGMLGLGEKAGGWLGGIADWFTGNKWLKGTTGPDEDATKVFSDVMGAAGGTLGGLAGIPNIPGILTPEAAMGLPTEGEVVSPLPPAAPAMESISSLMERDQASAAPGTASVQSEALDDIALQSSHLATLAPILATLERIETAIGGTEPELTGQGPNQEVPNMVGQRRAPRPPSFRDMPIGIFGQSPHRAVRNQGLH